MNHNKKLLKPKYDVVFQALFQSNKENITENLITDIIGEKVKIVEIRTDETLVREYPDEKLGRLDLKTKFEDGTICQIEMQLANQNNLIERILYYWSKTYSGQLKRGDSFSKLEKTIGIIITDFEIKEMKGIERLDNKWQIMETGESRKILTNKLELRIIEIPKARRIIEKEKQNRIAQWMMFLDNPNTKGVQEIMEENKEVKKAASILYEMSEDEKLQRLAELKEKYIMDEIARTEMVEEAQRKLEESKKAVEESKKAVEEEKKKTEEIVKKLKEKKMSVEEIVEITGMTKEEINKII